MAASPTNRTLQEVSSSVYPKLERKPGKQNWVDYAGGLPSYIERIAKHLHYEKGKDISTAIAIAVNTVKKWATGVNHNGSKLKPDTVAKAQAAVAEWEAKKAKAKGKSLAEAAYNEAPGGIEMSAEDRASVVGTFSHRLTLLEGFALNLKGASTKGKSAALDNAIALLEGREVKLAIGGGNADSRALARAQSALGKEAAELRSVLEAFEGPQVRAARRDVKQQAKGRNGQAVFDESKHPRAGKGQPTGGQFIRKGATGSEVKGIQRALGIKADGKFGNKTKSRVEEFQRNHGLTVDGVVGAQTAGALHGTEAVPGPLLSHHRGRLRKISQKVEKQYSKASLAAADAKEKRENKARKARKEARKEAESKAKSSSSSSSSSSATGTDSGVGSTLGPDSSLPEKVVQLIQRKLGIDTSGSYDEATEKAIRKFQRDHGLLVDGIVGTQTLAALRGDESPPEPGAFSESDWSWLTQHQAGGQRERRHERQKEHRQERRQRQEEKQEERELRVEEAMVKDDFVRRYGAGMTGAPDEATGHLQRRLTELGYEPGADDGRYGEKTKGAVSKFQGDHGLKEDGEVGHDTKLALRGTDPEEVARRRTSEESETSEEKSDEKNAQKPVQKSDQEPAEGEQEEKEPSERHSLAGAVLTKGAGVDAEDADPSVEQMQSIIGTEVDGRFGPETEKKLKSVQRRYGLKADGVVGPKTGRLLDRMASKHKPDPKKMKEAALDAAILDRMEAAVAGDNTAFIRARAREEHARQNLAEASLRGIGGDLVRSFYRLDDGTFAPKGMGRILKPGEEIKLPHRNGEGSVRARIEPGGNKGRGIARILDGPDEGQLAAVRTAAPAGTSPRGFPRPLSRKPAPLPPGDPSSGAKVQEVKSQNYRDAINHHITKGEDHAVQDHLDDMESDHQWSERQGYGKAIANYDAAKSAGEHFLTHGEPPQRELTGTDEIARAMRGGGETITTPAGTFKISEDEGGWYALDTSDPESEHLVDQTRHGLARQLSGPQRAPIDFTAKSDAELDQLQASISDESGVVRTNGRDRSIFQAITKERKRRAERAYRDAKSDKERASLADLVAQWTGRRPQGAPQPQYSPPEGYAPNESATQIKEMGPGDTFYIGKYSTPFVWHKQVGPEFIVAKPVGGGKAKPFHMEMAPTFLGPHDDSYPNQPASASAQEPTTAGDDDLFDKLKASIKPKTGPFGEGESGPPLGEVPSKPKSPARSPSGNLRNFKAMSDKKLYDLAVEMKQHPDDTDAVKAIVAEMQVRSASPTSNVTGEHPEKESKPSLPKTHEPPKVKSADEKIAAAWGAYQTKKAEFDALPDDADKATRAKLASQVRAAKFRIKRVGGDPNKPPSAAPSPPKKKAKPAPKPKPKEVAKPARETPKPPAADFEDLVAQGVEKEHAKKAEMVASQAAMKLGPDWGSKQISAALDQLEEKGLSFDREQESPDTLAAVIKAAGLNPADLKTIGTTS
jgi:peptidoglycan hydrolase-like protein with peptidoglycan-binding domain